MNEIIRVGPVPYRVQLQEDLRDDGVELDGWVRTSFQTIGVRPGFPAEYTTALVMHEIVHAILIQAGQCEFSQNEGLIDALSYGLTSVRVGDEPLLDAIARLIERLGDVDEDLG